MTSTDKTIAAALEGIRRAPLVERSGRFIIKGKASEIDRQLKAMCAVEARMGRVPSNDNEGARS